MFIAHLTRYANTTKCSPPLTFLKGGERRSGLRKSLKVKVYEIIVFTFKNFHIYCFVIPVFTYLLAET